jgi:hypothetical protein
MKWFVEKRRRALSRLARWRSQLGAVDTIESVGCEATATAARAMSRAVERFSSSRPDGSDHEERSMWSSVLTRFISSTKGSTSMPATVASPKAPRLSDATRAAPRTSHPWTQSPVLRREVAPLRVGYCAAVMQNERTLHLVDVAIEVLDPLRAKRAGPPH